MSPLNRQRIGEHGRALPPTKLKIANVRYVLIAKFCAESGYTEKAIRRKIEDGVWLENREFIRGPDGRIFIDMMGFERWVEGRRELSRRSAARSD